MTRRTVLVTCEHGGNDVPAELRPLFRGRGELLRSHRGYDPGTLGLARDMAGRLGASLVASTLTRLVTDLNRSPHNPRVFSEVTRVLPKATRRELLDRYHRPHWDAIHDAVGGALRSGGTLLHLGIHSFTPVLNEELRNVDVAILYDPARPSERRLGSTWARELAAALPDRRVRRNNPYRGSADGVTTALRRLHPDREYVGIEVEVNQRFVNQRGRFPAWVADALLDSLP